MKNILKKTMAMVCATACAIGCMTGCVFIKDSGKESGNDALKDITVYMPDGAPALALAKLMHEDTEDDGLTYFIPLCEGCGGEEENLELGDSEMVFLLKEAKAISEKGKWEYKKIKRAHMKEAFKELYALMEKPRKTLIITGIAVGMVVILAIILFAILGE